MAIPSRVNYDEALKFAKIRLLVRDPELKGGQVELVTIPTNRGPLEEPYGMEGGFAIVYKYRTQSGQLRALRCFKTRIDPTLKYRYEKISTYFPATASTITAGFVYHDPGIKVVNEAYPLIEMEWVEGVTLLQTVDELCRKKNRAGLKKLTEQWLELCALLRRASIAHGDLAANNVMVRPSGQLTLIDYDGVYIPDFAGMPPTILGQPDYQHHKVQARPFNESMDDFSALVIYTALLALSHKPELWGDLTERDPKGKLLNDNLLFKKEDYVSPAASPVFKKLRAIQDKDFKETLSRLTEACGLPVEQIRWNPKPADYEEQQAVLALEEAVRLDADALLVERWLPLLDSYPPAQAHRPRVELARQRLSHLQTLRKALWSRNEEQIAKAYNPILDGSTLLLPAERQAVEAAQKCVMMPEAVRRAIGVDDDQAIAASYDETLRRPWMNFTPDEIKRIHLARHRSAAWLRLKLALQQGDDDAIIAVYDSSLDGHSLVDAVSRQQVEQARARHHALQAFRRALWSKDEHHIVNAYTPILDGSPKVLPAERLQLEKARRCVEMPQRVRLAIQADDDAAIMAVYDNFLLRPASGFTEGERARIQLAQQRAASLQSLQTALQSDDDDRILSVYDPILAGYKGMTKAAQERVALAQQRHAALQRLRRGLSSQDMQQIAEAYDPILDGYAKVLEWERHQLQQAQQYNQARIQARQAIQADDDQAILAAWTQMVNPSVGAFTPAEQERIQLAAQRQNALLHLNRALMSDDDDQIVSAYDPSLDGSKGIPPLSHQRIQLAQQRKTALNRLRRALWDKDERQVAQAYDPILDGYPKLFPQEREAVTKAQRCLQMPAQVRQAIHANDDAAIEQAYDASLVCPFTGFTDAEQQRIELAHQRRTSLLRFRQALVSRNEFQIVAAYDPLLDGNASVLPTERVELELAQRCVTMTTQLRQAIQADDDETIVTVYDAALVRPAAGFTAQELGRINEACRRHALIQEVHQALDSQDLEQALRLERGAPFPLRDARLGQAKQQWLTPLSPKALTMAYRGDTLWVQWEWPASRWIEVMAVVWRSDRMPLVPDEPGNQREYVSRSVYEQNQGFALKVGPLSEVYIHLFAALKDEGPLADANGWLYAGSQKPAQGYVSRPCLVEWILTGRPGSSERQLLLRGEGGLPLPELVVVRRVGGTPLSPQEGEIIYRVVAAENGRRTEVLVPLSVASWPAGTVLRLFAARDEELNPSLPSTPIFVT